MGRVEDEGLGLRVPVEQRSHLFPGRRQEDAVAGIERGDEIDWPGSRVDDTGEDRNMAVAAQGERLPLAGQGLGGCHIEAGSAVRARERLLHPVCPGDLLHHVVQGVGAGQLEGRPQKGIADRVLEKGAEADQRAAKLHGVFLAGMAKGIEKLRSL